MKIIKSNFPLVVFIVLLLFIITQNIACKTAKQPVTESSKLYLLDSVTTMVYRNNSLYNSILETYAYNDKNDVYLKNEFTSRSYLWNPSSETRYKYSGDTIYSYYQSLKNPEKVWIKEHGYDLKGNFLFRKTGTLVSGKKIFENINTYERSWTTAGNLNELNIKHISKNHNFIERYSFEYDSLNRLICGINTNLDALTLIPNNSDTTRFEYKESELYPCKIITFNGQIVYRVEYFPNNLPFGYISTKASISEPSVSFEYNDNNQITKLSTAHFTGTVSEYYYNSHATIDSLIEFGFNSRIRKVIFQYDKFRNFKPPNSIFDPGFSTALPSYCVTNCDGLPEIDFIKKRTDAYAYMPDRVLWYSGKQSGDMHLDQVMIYTFKESM